LIAQNYLGIQASPASFAFAVLVQLGTLLALGLFYWKDLLQIATTLLQGVSKRKPLSDPDSRLGWLVILASIPALAVGYLLRKVVEGLFQEPLMEAGIRLLITSLLLVAAELISRGARRLEDMDWKDALVIGSFQVISVFPGASRSGSTIAAGMLRNLDRSAAARFAFLMSAPVMLVAGAYQAWQLIELPNTTDMLPLLIIGFASAAIVGWLALRWLVNYLKHHSLYVFASYTGLVGLICLGLYYFA
jgi:undecaprenyl-diphosphatase